MFGYRTGLHGFGYRDAAVPTPSPEPTPTVRRVVLEPGANGAWDDEFVAPENVIFTGGKYWLAYEGRGGGGTSGVGLASSTDLETWTKSANNPVVSAVGVYEAPFLYEENGTFYLLVGSDPGNRNIVVSLYSASDVEGPYSFVDDILTPEGSGWDAGRVMEPHLFVEGGTYYLFYMGDASVGGSANPQEQVGLATATAIDGPYTKDSGNPILAYGTSGEWDDGLVADPWVFKKNGTYYLGYTGGPSPNGNAWWRTGLARASDPAGPWERHPDNPILTPSVWGDAEFTDQLVQWRGAHFQSQEGDDYIVYGGANRQSAPSAKGFLVNFPDVLDWQAAWTRVGSESGHEDLTYTGSWGSFLDSGTGRTVHASNTTSDTVTFEFNGTAVRWRARAANVYGIASVSIDGGAADTVDLYASAGINEEVVAWEALDLAPGAHTVTVTVTGTKNPSSGGTYVSVAAFEYK